MAENQMPTPMSPSPSPNPMPAAKKSKGNPVIPALIIFGAIAAFLAVWWMAVR